MVDSIWNDIRKGEKEKWSVLRNSDSRMEESNASVDKGRITMLSMAMYDG